MRPGYLELRQTASDTYSLLFKIPALGDDLRLAIYVNLPEGTHDVTPAAGRVQRRCLHRTPHHPARRRARGTDRCHRRLVGHVHGRAGADREALGGATQTERLSPTRTTFVVQAAPGAGDVAATYLRLGHRAYPVRLRSSAVRPGAGDPGSRLAARCAHGDGVHRCAQHHARGGDARLGQRARPAGRGRHRAQHRAGRRRDRECTARDAFPGGALAVARRFLLRSPARLRLCRRPGRSGIAASCDPHRAFVLQSGRGDRATGLRGCGLDGGRAVPPRHGASPRGPPWSSEQSIGST